MSTMVTKIKKYLITIALILLASTVWSDNTGEKNPASAANESSPTTAWQAPTDVFSSNDNWATYAGTAADTIYITNFSMGVTADATIDTIFVSVEGHGTATQAARRRVVYRMVKDGTAVVGEQSSNYGLNLDNDGTIRDTGPTTPLFNTTFTAAEVNASTFGIALWKTASQAGTILLDHVTIYIAYTEAGGAKGTIMRTIIQ